MRGTPAPNLKVIVCNCRRIPKRREHAGKGGIGLDKKRFANLLKKIDRKIDKSEPLRAEYLRGYHRGLQVHFLGVSDERTEEHCMLINHSGGGSGDPFIDSYARGYRHGFEGISPEGPSSFSSSSSLKIASIV